MGFVIKQEASQGESKYVKPEPGTHVARCVQMIELGTWEDKRWEDSYPKNEIVLGFEFPNIVSEESGPALMWKRVTWSLGERATLRKILKSWRGKDYTASELAHGVDVSAVVGQPCQITVEEWVNATTGKSGVQIGSIAKLMDGVTCPPQVSSTVMWSISDWDQETFDTFADHLKERILASDEAKARTASDPQDKVEASDDIPF
jgi:hypothetical protein